MITVNSDAFGATVSQLDAPMSACDVLAIIRDGIAGYPLEGHDASIFAIYNTESKRNRNVQEN